MWSLKSSVRRCHRVYSHLIPRSRLITLVVAVDRSGRARAGVVLHDERLRDTLSGMMSVTADPCAFRDLASLPARMDWPDRVNWIGRRRGRVNTADRLDPGPLYHVRNARRMLYDFRRWLRPFRGVATKYLLRYFSWYLRIAAMAHTRKSMDPVFGHVFIYEHCLPFDVSRAYDEAKGIKNPRIWTAERDKEMWAALQA